MHQIPTINVIRYEINVVMPIREIRHPPNLIKVELQSVLKISLKLTMNNNYFSVNNKNDIIKNI